jgi:hypothetical protein
MKKLIDNGFIYLVILFAIPCGIIVGVSKNADQLGLGLFFLTLGLIGALTLQSKSFSEWLKRFFLSKAEG